MYKLNKKNKIIIIGLIVVIFFTISYYIYAINGEEEIVSYNTNFFENKNEEEKNQIQEEKSTEIIVHVAGCVVNEGIIKLKENSRISDAIDAAGGMTEEADISNINLALVIEDGMKIYVPSIKNKEENAELNSVTQSTNTKVNINTANQSELETLPGIGSSTAQKIIIYRKENGKFNFIEDIKNVKGIGTSKFEKIKELICVK